MKLALKITFTIFLILLSLVFSVFAYLIIVLRDYNLDENKLKTNLITYEFYDYNDDLAVKETFGGKNAYVKIKDLNKNTLNAFIAIEDRNFYNHNGFSVKRIIGATINNLKSMSLKEGGSTISQQLIKNTHLNSKKTIKRKLIELKITMQLEKRCSKNEILEKYLNTIYFGKGNYGIESASQYYFGKNAKNLTLNESAVLAGIIKSPKTYSPSLSIENSFARKNLVLRCMYDCGFISQNQLNSNLSKEILLNQGNISSYLDNYVYAVKNEIDNLSVVDPYQNSTVKVYTFLDKNLQRQIYDVKVNEVEKYNKSQIVINNKNKGIIAFYGNNSNLKRCPASCVKPWLVYAPMIDDKYITSSSVVSDSYVNYNGYSPKNYNDKFLGNVTVKDALKLSLNVPSVKLVDGYTIKKINKYTQKLGVKIDNEGLSCALGSIKGGLSLKELCDKYLVFSNNGNYDKSSFINKIVINNKVVYKKTINETNVFSNETAFIISDILKDSVKSGTSKNLNCFNFDLCAKTGTNGVNEGNLDAYSIAYTKNHTVGVWIGNEDNSIMPNSITGGTYPTIFTREILSLLYKNSKPDNFDVPSGVIKLNIDKNALINSQELLIDTKNNGEDFYFIKGTEPKNVKNLSEIKVNYYDISLNNNLITIKNSCDNSQKLKIIKNYQGKDEIIYYDKYIESFDYLLKSDGIYNFTLLFENEYGNSKKVNLKSIKYTKNLNNIQNKDWWNL